MRVGRTLTHHFEIETRQYDLLGIDLGEGARRRMIIFGAVIIVLWVALLFPFIGVPRNPPSVCTSFRRSSSPRSAGGPASSTNAAAG